jgi:hypothetical protein
MSRRTGYQYQSSRNEQNVQALEDSQALLNEEGSNAGYRIV